MIMKLVFSREELRKAVLLYASIHHPNKLDTETEPNVEFECDHVGGRLSAIVTQLQEGVEDPGHPYR